MSEVTFERLQELMEQGVFEVRKHVFGNQEQLPQVSVIVVHHYQIADWWDKCFNSVKGQRHLKTWELVEVWAPTKDLSIGFCKNAGLAGASADWVMFLDDDDWLHPDCIANLLRVQRKDGGDMVRCPVIEVDATGKGNFSREEDAITHMGLVRKQLVLPAGGFDLKNLEEDIALDDRMRRLGAKITGTRTPLYYYRLHRTQASASYKEGAWYEHALQRGYSLDV